MPSQAQERADAVAEEVSAESIEVLAKYTQTPSVLYVGPRVFLFQSCNMVARSLSVYRRLMDRAGVARLEPKVMSLRHSRLGEAAMRVSTRYRDGADNVVGQSLVDYYLDCRADHTTIRLMSILRWPFPNDLYRDEFFRGLDQLEPRQLVH